LFINILMAIILKIRLLRLAGIFDDIWIFAAQRSIFLTGWQQLIFDEIIQLKTQFSADIRNYSVTKKWHYNPAIPCMIQGNSYKTLTTEKFSIYPNPYKPVRLTGIITNPDKWSAEHPTSISLHLNLLTHQANGKLFPRIGFRRQNPRPGVLPQWVSL